MAKIAILFIVGIILAGIPIYFVITEPTVIVDNFYILFVAGFGVFLLIASFHYGDRKVDRFMDRD